MAQSYGPKPINADGLVFCMDAGNPASFTSGSSIVNNVAPYALSTQTGSVINSAQYNSDGGGCWEFDGTDDRIDCDTMRNILSPTAASGSGVASENLQNYTIEIWLKGDSIANYDVAIGSTSSNFHNQSGWSIVYHNNKLMADGTWGKESLPDGGRKYPSSTITSTTLQSNFHQCVVTYNGSTVEIYVDGVLGTLYDAGTVNGDMFKASEGMSFGGTQQPSWAEWDGWIASVKIYKRALSLSEILDNYKNQLPRFE